MALSANTQWEVRTAGLDTNGGGFVAGATGTDFSQQNAKNTVGNNISTTDAVAVGTGVITSTTAAFTSAIVGNIIYLQGGTGTLTAGWYQVTVFTSATSITVDRNVGAGTGITMNIGGALLSLGMSGASVVAFNTIWVKTGSYSITSATINVTGGCLSSAANSVRVEGYGVTRGDQVSPPTLTASGISTATLISLTGTEVSCTSFILDGASLTSIRGCIIGRGIAVLLTTKNFTNSGVVTSNGAGKIIRCTATGCSTQPAIRGAVCIYCESFSNTITGFDANNLADSACFVNCLSYNNSGATSQGFLAVLIGTFINCVAYGNGQDGFNTAATGNGVFNQMDNCVAEANGRYGFNDNGVVFYLRSCASFNNTSVNNLSAGTFNSNFVSGSSTFFVAAGSSNFALNNTAGAGASLRAAGYPASYAAGSTLAYPDIGAVQHQDPASAGMLYMPNLQGT